MSPLIALSPISPLLAAFEMLRVAIVVGTGLGLIGGVWLLVWLGRWSWRSFQAGRTGLGISLVVVTLAATAGFAMAGFYGIVMSGFALFYHQ